MNAQRRKAIEDIRDRLNNIQSDLQRLKEEEEGAYDNMPESLQYSERGERMQEAIDAFCEADENCSELIGSIEELLNY